jgi:DMSO reductase anchor subunit
MVMPILVLFGAGALWVCTAMIYACLRFIEEWAHPLTLVNFTLIGLSSGSVLACALAGVFTEVQLLNLIAPFALGVTLLAWAVRVVSLRRNAAIKHKSTLQSATGIRGDNLVQKSMGMSAGSFNTREFFHGASQFAVQNVKLGFLVLTFALPVALMALALMTQSIWPWLLAALLQTPGLIAERWFFFAQAKHPQNLYYQVVS